MSQNNKLVLTFLGAGAGEAAILPVWDLKGKILNCLKSNKTPPKITIKAIPATILVNHENLGIYNHYTTKSDIISYICKHMVKLNAKQLRKGSHQLSAISHQTIKRNDIYIILDNVLDTYNIGGIFRLADAVGAKKVYLCGDSETPPNHRIKKASINTTEWVEWEYCETALEAVSRVKGEAERVKVIAVEQSKKSVQYDQFDYSLPICLVVGHETHGVSKEVLEIADGIVEIPMYGVNISLNVIVSLAIVLYEALASSPGQKAPEKAKA